MSDPFAARRKQQGVSRTVSPLVADAVRAANAPRKDTQSVLDLSRWSLTPPAGTEPFALRPVQIEALREIRDAGGGLLPIGVGHGKTIVSLLAGMVLEVDVAVIIAPPATIPGYHVELARLQQHFALTYEIQLISWGVLSQADGEDRLPTIACGQKAVLVADEAHYARNAGAARTQRLFRWLARHGECHFVALSGTLTTRSLEDFAHLAARSLGAGSPCPSHPRVVQAWSGWMAGGELNLADVDVLSPLRHKADTQVDWIPSEAGRKSLREGFRKHLLGTRGVVGTSDPSCSASLYLYMMQDAPAGVKEAVGRVSEWATTYRDEDGQIPFSDADYAAVARRAMLGYRYRWEWDGQPDYEWIEARSHWATWCRRVLAKYSQSGFDSPLLVEREAESRLARGSSEPWVQAWAEWNEIRDRTSPRTVVEWETTDAVAYLVELAAKADALLWYDEQAVADVIEHLGLPTVRSGETIPNTGKALAVSVRSHGTGVNLQAWNRNVFSCVPANGTTWEQVLGRTHRLGQQEDEVTARIPAWGWAFRRALKQATKDAAWIEESTGARQKLVFGRWIGA